MKNATKLVCLMMAVLMMAVALVSCADTGDSNTTTTGPVTTGRPSHNSGVVPTVPDGTTFPDQTVTVIASNYDWFSDEIYVEAETGSAIPDAVWKRNDLVQKKLGIIFNYAGQDSSSGPGGTNKVLGEVEKQYSSGLNDYSVAVGNSYSTSSATMENHFVDLTDMSQYFDLEKPYWSQGVNDALSIGNAQYVCTGAMVLSSYRLIYGTLFNETLFNNHEVELPYDKVEKKEWTMAYQRSLVETFCDAEVDQMMVKFPIMDDYKVIDVGNKKLFLTHGHLWNEFKVPPIGMADVLVHGHTHIPEYKNLVVNEKVELIYG